MIFVYVVDGLNSLLFAEVVSVESCSRQCFSSIFICRKAWLTR